MILKKLNSLLNKSTCFFEGTIKEVNFLPFFRITIGLIALIDLASMSSDIHLFFSNSKAILPQELMYLESQYFIIFQPFFNFLINNNLESFFYSTIIWIYIFALILLIIGMFSRAVSIIALISQLLIFKTFPDFNYGYDNFLTMSLFYCTVFPVGKYLSLDKYFFKTSDIYVFNYQRVIQIHLCIVYFFSGIFKSLDVSWWNGNSMWKAIASTTNNYYQIYPVILLLLGIGTVLLETSYIIFVSIKITRKPVVLLCIAMHLGIALMLKLYSFAAIMIVWNIAAFYNIQTVKYDVTGKVVL